MVCKVPVFIFLVHLGSSPGRANKLVYVAKYFGLNCSCVFINKIKDLLLKNLTRNLNKLEMIFHVFYVQRWWVSNFIGLTINSLLSCLIVYA